MSDPVLEEAVAASLALAIAVLLLEHDTLMPSPDMAYAMTGKHGFVVCEVGATQLDATVYLFKEDQLIEDVQYGLDETSSMESFLIVSKVKSADHQQDGEWRRWNPETVQWAHAS